jgi:hypothetical protein
MTATVQPESKAPSRRALLAGALGGLGALAANAIGRASPVRAANGDPVTVGGVFTGTANTEISTTSVSAFEGISSHTFASAVLGRASAVTGTTFGLYGQSFSTLGTGVYGFAGASSGQTYGVYGHSDSPAGVGVYAANGYGGVALKSAGRTKLSTSGVATIGIGSRNKSITPGVNVTSSSFVLLTPKVRLGGRDLWFTTNAADDKFTIHMSSARSTMTQVAWLLLG